MSLARRVMRRFVVLRESVRFASEAVRWVVEVIAFLVCTSCRYKSW